MTPIDEIPTVRSGGAAASGSQPTWRPSPTTEWCVIAAGAAVALLGAFELAHFGASSANWAYLEAVGVAMTAAVACLRREDASSSALPRPGLSVTLALLALVVVSHSRSLPLGFLSSDDWLEFYISRIFTDLYIRTPDLLQWYLDHPIHLVHSGLDVAFNVERLLFGEWAPGFRLVNLILLCLASFELYRLSAHLTRNSHAAFLGAALFVTHPRLWETATEPCCQDFPLFIVFVCGGLNAFLEFLEHGRRRDWVVSLLAVCIAAFIREMIFLVPVIFLAGAMFAVERPRCLARVGVLLAPHFTVATIVFVHVFAPALFGRDATQPGFRYLRYWDLLRHPLGLARTLLVDIPVRIAAPAETERLLHAAWINLPYLLAAAAGVAVLARTRRLPRGARLFLVALLTVAAAPLAFTEGAGSMDERHLALPLWGWSLFAAMALSSLSRRLWLVNGVTAAAAAGFFLIGDANVRSYADARNVSFASIEEAQSQLRAYHPGQQIIVVLDDVPSPCDVKALIQGILYAHPHRRISVLIQPQVVATKLSVPSLSEQPGAPAVLCSSRDRRWIVYSAEEVIRSRAAGAFHEFRDVSSVAAFVIDGTTFVLTGVSGVYTTVFDLEN